MPTDEEAAILTRLAELTERISDYILRSEQILKERIGDIMGGKVLELETDKILAQGLAQATVSFVKKMLTQNEPLEKICLYTGCSMDQVLQIKEHMASE